MFFLLDMFAAAHLVGAYLLASDDRPAAAWFSWVVAVGFVALRVWLDPDFGFR